MPSPLSSSEPRATNEIRGRCACGQLRYEVAGSPLQVVSCHCDLCKRMSGGPFSVYVVVREKDLRLTVGETRRYAATDRTTKHFCGCCGTPMFNANPVTYKGLAMLYVGTTEVPARYEPRMHIFCESRLEWVAPNAGSQLFSRSPGEGP